MIKIREILGLEYYESELDQFLKAFDNEHPKLSASQRKEINKYKRIYDLRDHSGQKHEKPRDELWENF